MRTGIDPKLVLAAIREARECYKGAGKEVSDVQELLAGVIAGKFGDQKIPLAGDGEGRVRFMTIPRPGEKPDGEE